MKINYIKNFSIKLKPVPTWQERQKKFQTWLYTRLAQWVSPINKYKKMPKNMHPRTISKDIKNKAKKRLRKLKNCIKLVIYSLPLQFCMCQKRWLHDYLWFGW